MKSELKLFTGNNLVEICNRVNEYADTNNISIESVSIDAHGCKADTRGCRACMMVAFDNNHRCDKGVECVTAFDEATFNGNLEMAMERIATRSSVYNPIVDICVTCSEVRYTGVILYQGI